MRIRPYLAPSLALISLAACAPGSPDATDSSPSAATSQTLLTCTKLTVQAGSVGDGQASSALAKAELTGKKDVWNDYVEFAPGSSATCSFSLPAGANAANLGALSLRTNYRGPKKSEMTWLYEAWDAAAGAWVSIGDNGFAGDWVWSSADLPVAGAATRFFDSSGTMKVRYRTTSNHDASDLDELVVVTSTSGSGAGGGGQGTGGQGTGGASSTGGAGGKAAGGATGAGGAAGGAGKGGAAGGGSGAGGAAGGGSGAGGAGSWWKPTNNVPLHFHWQLSTTFSYPSDVVPGQTIYDIDGDDNSAATVAQLHGAGFKAICYMEVGSVENYRADYQQFVDAGVVGKEQADWPGEYWLNISSQANVDKILPLMKARMVNWCANKGFDAIEPDTSDVEGATPAQVISYAKQIAEMAHALGLGIGLKNNAGSNATALEPYYDWSLVEQCWEYDECDSFRTSFLAHNKPVWNVEYNQAPNCASADAWHMISMKRDLELVGPHSKGYLYQPCLPDSQTSW